MKARHNLSDAFHRQGAHNTLLTNLGPDEQMLGVINSAEALIRRELSAFFVKALTDLMPEGIQVPKPKFLRQGSNAYETLNDPLRSSEHYAEADSDLGQYFPLEFVKNGSRNPRVGAEKIRELTLAGLRVIAAKQFGWKVSAKKCCDRVYIRSDAYIDVTSYAIPKDQHRRMAEARMALSFRDALAKSDRDWAEAHEITWDEIPETSLLATLNGWVRSDAKAVNRSVNNMAALYGAPFKQTVRFEKALRDFNDDEDGPNSISLTLLTGERLDINICRLGRLDFAIVSVLGEVADGLFEFLPSPGNPDIDIMAGMTYEAKVRLADMLRNKQALIDKALNAPSLESAHDILKTVFGARFPDPPENARPQTTKPAKIVVPATPLPSKPTRPKAIAPRGNAHSA